MHRSFLDLLGGPTTEETTTRSEATIAPLEIVTEFLCAVSDNNIAIALNLCEQILIYEPTNKMMNDYQKALKELLDQQAREASDSSEGDAEEVDTSDELNSGDETSEISDDGDSERDEGEKLSGRLQ